MSSDPFLLALLATLLSRRLALRRGPLRTSWPHLLWPLLLTPLFGNPLAWLLFSATLVILQGTHLRLSRGLIPAQVGHLLSLGITLLVWLLVLGRPEMAFRPALPAALDIWAGSNPLLARLAPDFAHRLLVQATALWVATVELNELITMILNRYALIPAAGAPKANRHEPARGRVIGWLERGIVCLLALHGHLEALGLLLAAKGFARFKDMDDRNFAEYVLIGTLLSVSSALLVGLLFTLWL